jgi:hypothetical protein
VKVNNSAWLAGALALSADLYVKNLSPSYNKRRDLHGFFIAVSCVIIAVALLIWAKVTSIMEKLLHSELKAESMHGGGAGGITSAEFFRHQKR